MVSVSPMGPLKKFHKVFVSFYFFILIQFPMHIQMYSMCVYNVDVSVRVR